MYNLIEVLSSQINDLSYVSNGHSDTSKITFDFYVNAIDADSLTTTGGFNSKMVTLGCQIIDTWLSLLDLTESTESRSGSLEFTRHYKHTLKLKLYDEFGDELLESNFQLLTHF